MHNMRILNVRLGLATNSSSTHSLIFLPKGAKAGEIPEAGDRQYYGWDYFQLTRPESKLDYLAQSIYQQLRCSLGDDIAMTVAREWAGRDVARDGYVDHQSALTFPRNWEGKGLDREFLAEFKEFLLRKDVVIVGGNDNDEKQPEVLATGGEYRPGLDALPREDYGSSWVARKDGDYWTLFHRDNGTKIRMTFKGDAFDVVPRRSSAPELIDIKITNYCPFECGYCYQGSTRQGTHANNQWLSSLVYRLRDLKVFEVAIGGGEPTLHPHFIEILRAFRQQCIVPNFTTKNLGWLRDEEKSVRLLKLAGAFAFSCEKAEDVRELAALLKKRDFNRRKVTIQHVVGVVEEEVFRDVLLACAENHFPITLLGYKMVGRGPEFGAKPSSKWLSVVRDVCDEKHLCVGIDTALADRHWDDLIDAGVDPLLMTRVEGQFSCYIDAVARTINTSSYTDTPGLRIQDGLVYNDSNPGIQHLYQALPR